MYALYKKYVDGYTVKVEVLAYSEDKNELMQLIPFEVERYVRETNKRMLHHELKYYLPRGHQPIEYWTRGAFAETEFGIQEVKTFTSAHYNCVEKLNALIEENEKYLKSIGIE